MTNRLALLLLALSLAACSSDEQRARQLLADSLKIKEDLEFHELRTYPGNVVCGEFSATTSYTGPREEHRPFIVIGDKLEKSPLTADLRIYCKEDPARALQEAYGVGPVDASNTALIKILSDYSRLAGALEAYYTDNYYYPTAEQGLAALVSRPEDGRPLSRYREGGYLDSIPTDPWNRPYLYSEEQWGRTKGRYEVKTLGRSGEPGGEGAEADVSSGHLPYLQHVARVAGIE